MVEKKKKKGFTLIELLATIVILTLVFSLGFILISGLLGDSEEMVDEATEKMILNAAEQYAIEFRNENAWKEQVDANGNVLFCVTLDSLINYGYFGNDDSISKYKDDYLVKITIKNGVYDYELLEKSSAGDVCRYFDNGSQIVDNSSGRIEFVEDGVDIDFGYDVSKKGDKVYEVYVDLSLDIIFEEILQSIPTYVTLLVDNSSSMSGTKYTNAKSAAIEFSEEILKEENIPDAQISLVLYNTKVYPRRDFVNDRIVDSLFSAATGATNTSGGIDYVTSMIYKKQKNNEISLNDNIYTILLYDGLPSYCSEVNSLLSTSISTNSEIDEYFSNFIGDNYVYCVNTGCNEHVVASAGHLKNFGSKLIVIGYGMSSVDEELKTIATQDPSFCLGSDYADYCYFNSDSANISSLFSKLSSTIVDNVKTTDAKSAKVILTSPIVNGDKAFTIEKNGVKLAQIEDVISIDGNELNKELFVDDTFRLVINENVFNNCDTQECQVNIGVLFDVQIILEYDDAEDRVINIDRANLPSFVVTRNENAIVN